MGIVQGLFIGLTLIMDKTYATRNNRYVGMSLVLFSLQGLLDLLSFGGYNNQYLWADVVTCFGLQSIILVPYFLLILDSTKAKFPLPRYVLFIPFALSLIYGLIASVITLLGVEHLYWDRLRMSEFWTFHWYLNMIFIVVMNGYLYLLIKRTSSENKQEGPYPLWRSFSILIALWLLIHILHLFISDVQYLQLLFTIFWGSFTFFMFWITYIGIIHQRLNSEQKSLHFILKLSEEAQEKPTKTVAPNNYYEAFIQLMENEKIYRQADLTRDKVAKRLGISPGYFSTLLSQSSEQSFNEILNEYRVKEVMKILSNGSLNHFSLTAIGLEVGYKSKSAFFNNFKKITGLSPNSYKQKFQS